MMNELVAAGAGLLLGGFYFGGLLWTVKKVLSVKGKALLFILSYVVRTMCVGVGFYMVGSGSWQNFVTCLLGFLVARCVVIHMEKRYESGA
jgi:F1F0 ATPase subunit 2